MVRWATTLKPRQCISDLLLGRDCGGTEGDHRHSTCSFRTAIDHVVVGAGTDLDTRLGIVRGIFESSDATTVYMKDHPSGPQGFLPFVRSVLRGLADFRRGGSR